MSMKSNADITTYALRNNLVQVVSQPRSHGRGMPAATTPAATRAPARGRGRHPQERRPGNPCASCWSRIHRYCAAGSKTCCRSTPPSRSRARRRRSRGHREARLGPYDAIVVDVELRPAAASA
jgi:hypothetical protein